MFGLYVHLPVCSVKCDYCDFFSIVRDDQDLKFWKKYLLRLEEEIDFFASQFSSPLVSIFFGGGTPSKAPVEVIEQVIYKASKLFKFKMVEISLEANPESISLKKAKAWKNSGINRVNVGIQSRDFSILNYLGRIATKEGYDHCFSILKSAGFKKIGGDLIHGIPKLGENQIKKDIDWLIDSGVNHISAYSLTIEKDTKLASQIRHKKKNQISHLRQSLHFNFICEYLDRQGFKQYEVSNFARPGQECRHNLLYWKNRPFLGIGVSAHSYDGKIRFSNPRNLKKYFNKSLGEMRQGDSIDFWIGATRISSHQNWKSLPKGQSEIIRKLFANSSMASWVKTDELGFSILPKGLSFADSLLEKILKTVESTPKS